MVTKRYEITGLTRFNTFVEIDGKKVELNFTTGIMYYNKPASYTTSNVKIQDAIEQTQLFKSGRLYIARVTEDASARPAEVTIIKETEREKENVNADMLEFDTLKDLQLYLVKQHKIPFIEIRSRENALKKVEELELKVIIKG